MWRRRALGGVHVLPKPRSSKQQDSWLGPGCTPTWLMEWPRGTKTLGQTDTPLILDKPENWIVVCLMRYLPLPPTGAVRTRQG